MRDSGWHRYITYDKSKGEAKVDRALLGRVFEYGRPHLSSVIMVLLTIVTISLIELIPPLLYRDLIDNVLPNRDTQRLNWLALGMLGIPIASGLLSVVQRYFGAKAGEGIIFDLRQEMYNHLQQMSIRFFTNTKSGEIFSRFNNDVVGAQSAITDTIPSILTNSVTLISTLIVMVSIEWRLAVLAIAVLPLFLLPIRRVARILREIRREALEQKSNMSNSISETLTINGALLVKTFGRQRREIERFKEANAAVRDIGIRRALVGRWFFMGLGIASTIGTALIYWVGGHLVLDGAISVGTIVAFAAYLGRLYGPISALTNVQIAFATSMVSFERVFEYLDMPIEVANAPGALSLHEVKGDVVFESVSFQYGSLSDKEDSSDEDSGKEDAASGVSVSQTVPDHKRNGNGTPENGHRNRQRGKLGADPSNSTKNGADTTKAVDNKAVSTRIWALEDVSFSIDSGELVALVGPSGAGKTTVTYLLPRLYDPSMGRILLDGHDLRAVTLESLADQIGIVTQETYLLHDSILVNLLYARPNAGQDEVEAACRAANIHDRIMQFPDGYETVVGERGFRLSGGEKQRIAIARVILKDPRVLVLDEATSHLDSQSEALIQAALEPLMQNRTSLVIAHRLSTILAADKILVLDSGRLVESGTHADLLAKNGLYAHLYETQFVQTVQT